MALLLQAIAASGVSHEEVSRRIGSGLGEVVSQLVREKQPHARRGLGRRQFRQASTAMGLTGGGTALAPLAPGAPLCLARSRHAHLDGLEIALKGGANGQGQFLPRRKG